MSLKESPVRFNPKTTITMANPGKMVIHGAIERKDLPSLSIFPQLGAGGGVPIPRKLSAASAITAYAKMKLPWTSNTGRICGNT